MVQWVFEGQTLKQTAGWASKFLRLRPSDRCALDYKVKRVGRWLCHLYSRIECQAAARDKYLGHSTKLDRNVLLGLCEVLGIPTQHERSDSLFCRVAKKLRESRV